MSRRWVLRAAAGAGALATALSGCGAGDDSLPLGSLAPLQPSATIATTSSVTDSRAPASEVLETGVGAGSPGPSAPALSTSSPAAAVPAAPAPPGTTGAGVGSPVGSEGGAVDTSNPTTVVGGGTPAACTSAAVVAAVAAGGIITFSCGPAPLTIVLTETAKVVNAAADDVVIDGGGLVTLSGGGARRILYLNTCDQAQGWTTSHCDDQPTPRLTVQHITLADGNATGATAEGGGGGGAIFARGGRLTVVDTVFAGNRCDGTGPDLGGAGIRALDQSQDLPVHVVGSTFTGGRCSNGGGVSSIGVSWVIVDLVFTDNHAVGSGANPARPGTPGGGSGGAVYADGNRFTIRLVGTRIEGNRAAEGGGAVFFVSNDRTGSLSIESSTLRSNPSAGFETDGFPGIFFLGATPPAVSDSSLA